ncbi:MAG: hypothetical protein HY765_05950 [Rhodomicrobium sp.]|nr:hypothetical protein [Rhodomicrobium sp.]
MKYICAVLFIFCVIFRGDFALAKEMCTHAWAKGSYKSHKQVESELRERLANAKILRLSLCHSGEDYYFQVTILEASGKVRTVRVPAR